MRYSGVVPDPFATEGGTTYPILRSDLDARKRAVYIAFLAMGAAGALLSFAINLVRTTPDPGAAWIQFATAIVLGVAIPIVRWRRVPLVPLERATFVLGAFGVAGTVGWSLYGPDADVLGRSAVQATLHWVPLVFAFAFVAFNGRDASRGAVALLATVAALIVPYDVAAAAGGVSDDLFLLSQALVAYAVLIAGLRFFADLHVRASSLERTAERMRELAHTDVLTGLGNRRQAEVWLDREVQRATRYARPFAVLVLDIDHFKRLNDTHGHAAGDRVLTDLAGELVGMVRASDAVVRWGGEEFLVLAPETGLDDGVQVAELMRRQVSKMPFGGEHRITVSIGVAAHRAGDDPASLVARADAALYMAKRAGRNVVRKEIAAGG